jgi:gamma-glutamyltranspeptidase/glutathione hydrolase
VAPHHLSAAAALEIMASGGTAVDGAVAANAVQGVVAPETCGVGGDLFALVYSPGEKAPAVLNASGRAGSGADAQALRSAGYATVPFAHPEAVTVPGCVEGWSELIERFGRLPMARVLEPAIRHAAEGFSVSAELALSLELLQEAEAPADLPRDADLYPDGATPGPGDLMVRPELVATLESIASGGPDAFYQGKAGRAITAATSGRITMDDLASIRSDWVQPLKLEVFGSTGWTVPPNSQGYLTLATAWLFERLDPPDHPDDPDYFHLLVEAHRSVAWELGDLVADPAFAPLPPGELLNPDRLSGRLSAITPESVANWPSSTAPRGGTAFLCVLDGAGMGVSLIQSNYTGLGGGLAAEGAGFFLHNRGAGFNLRPGHPNELAPGKRPLHTLSPTMWTKNDRLELLLGTRGGSYQPQLLAQVAAHLLHGRLSPEESQARPRWVIDQDPELLRIESTAGETTRQALQAKGHVIDPAAELEPGWGPVSMIQIDESGLRTAAADPRVPTTGAAVL